MPHKVERFFEMSLDLLCIAGTDGCFKRVNPAFERVLGWAAEDLLQRPFTDFIHPEDVEATLGEVEKLARGIPTVSFENRYRCVDGNYRDLLWTANPEEETGLLYAVAKDITERKKAERRFELAVEASPTAMITVDTEGIIRLLNEAAEELFGYARDELYGRPVEVLVPDRFRERHPARREEFSRQATRRPMGQGRDLTALCKDGTEVPVEIGLSPAHSRDGLHVLSAVVNLTSRKEAEAKILSLAKELEETNRKLEELARTDALTGLSNRRACMEELDARLRLARRNVRPFSFLLVDIDHFKSINDRLGHPAGDEVLRQVSEVLRATARRSDLVARYGGEEFAIGLPDTDMAGATVLAENIRGTMERHSFSTGAITVSVGATTVFFSSTEPAEIESTMIEMIGEADKALYHCKESGRNRMIHWNALDAAAEGS